MTRKKLTSSERLKESPESAKMLAASCDAGVTWRKLEQAYGLVPQSGMNAVRVYRAIRGYVPGRRQPTKPSVYTLDDATRQKIDEWAAKWGVSASAAVRRIVILTDLHGRPRIATR